MRRTDSAAIVPVYNPEPGLKRLCEELLAAFETVIVVDDGSCEQTEDFASLPEGIRLLRHPVNRGKGRAIKTAIAWLKKNAAGIKVAVFADGDGQHRIDDIVAVADRACAEDRVVLGVRDFSGKGIPFRSRFGNVLTSFLVRLIYHFPIRDTQTGLRAIPRRLFDMMLTTRGERYEYEMRLFGRLRERHEPLAQVPIETIYIANNRASHFHPIRDSIRVYRGLFGGSFFRFILSSLGGFAIDNIAFSLLLLLLTGLGVGGDLGVLGALVPARILSAFVNYQCNRLLVFGSTVRLHISLRRYVLLAIALMGLSYLGTTFFMEVLGITGLAVTVLKIFVEVVLFILSYRVQQVWVFHSTQETEFDAVDAGKRLLAACGPVVPFAALLLVDIFVNLRGLGWQFGIGTIGYSLKCLILTLLPVLAVPLVFRRYARYVMPILFVWIFFVDIIELTAWNAFHMTVRGEILAILMGSSWKEFVSFMGEFMTLRTLLLVGLALVVLVYGCRHVWRQRPSYPSRPLSSYALALFLVVLGIKLGYDACDANSTYLVIDTIRQYSRYSNLAEAVKAPDVSDVIVPEHQVPVVVFVLGESATRDHWQLYGYARDTTPEISARADELIVFDDLLAPWSHTQEAVQLMLTRGTLSDRERVVATLPQVLSTAGYRCSLVSNQDQWGVWDSVVTLLFTGCDRTFFNDSHAAKSIEESLDDRLLPEIERELDAATDDRPLVLFVHLYGSHCPWPNRCPENRCAYLPAGKKHPVNSYDNSIRLTDALLGQILDKVKGLNREALMIYLSDHGDSPDADDSRVVDDPSFWRVPFFIWCSPQYRAAYPDRVAALEAAKAKPLQSDRLYDGFLELLNVSLRGREKESFLNAGYDWTVARRVMDGRLTVGPNWGGREKPPVISAAVMNETEVVP